MCPTNVSYRHLHGNKALRCAYYTGESSFEVKTEAHSSDHTEHSHDDKPRPYLCTVRNSSKVHRKRQTGETWYSCTQCEKRYSSSGALCHHMNIHRGKHRCTECGRCFGSKSNLAEHDQIHSGDKVYRSRQFSSRKRQTGENWYSCSQCEKRYSSSGALCHHMNMHSGKYKCTECGRCCTDKHNLAVHRRIHSGEKPFECSVCSKRFKASWELSTHSRIHSREKLYSCDECEKHFSTQHNLRQHMNIHRSKYKCTECGICCRDRSNLAVHRRSHSGEKPFECTVYSKQFTASNDLGRHIRSHSGERDRANVTCVTRRSETVQHCTVT